MKQQTVLDIYKISEIICLSQIFVFSLFFITLFTSCSKDDSFVSTDEAQKHLVEIAVTEHEKRFGEFVEEGSVYETFKYNFDGTLAFHFYSVGDMKIPYEEKYTYDENKRVKQIDIYRLFSLDRRNVYQYNNIDSVSSMIVYDKDGKEHELWTYEYDSNNRLSKSIEKDVYLGSTFGYICTYNYSGNEVDVIKTMYSDASVFCYYNYEYDIHGNLLQETYTNAETGKKDISKLNIYIYNADGTVARKAVREYYYRDNYKYFDYTYNPDGTISKIRVSYSYKLDESELRYNYIVNK